MRRDPMLQLRSTQEQRQLMDDADAAEGVSRSECILRSCQERAQSVLLDRSLFSLNPEQSQALLTELLTDLLAAPQPGDAAS